MPWGGRNVTTALGFLFSLDYQLQPGAPPLAVVFVVLTLVFRLAWGYFAVETFREPRRAS